MKSSVLGQPGVHEAGGTHITSVQIRQATAEDADAIALLMTELGYPASGAELKARLSALLPCDTQFIAVAEQSAEVVGWVAAEERLLLASGSRVELMGLVVSSTARRTGIGRRLVREAEAWARGRGQKTVLVRSNIVRAEAHPFYESLGYMREKTQHAYVRDLASG